MPCALHNPRHGTAYPLGFNEFCLSSHGMALSTNVWDYRTSFYGDTGRAFQVLGVQTRSKNSQLLGFFLLRAKENDLLLLRV